MSWPKDGEPRFVIASHPQHREGAAGRPEMAKGYVYDRAFCHRIVFTAKSTNERYARERARLHAFELNAAEALRKIVGR